ncbi:MAG: choice-of-anchor D domain-containing protein [Betaproteobacteria bacterium]
MAPIAHTVASHSRLRQMILRGFAIALAFAAALAPAQAIGASLRVSVGGFGYVFSLPSGISCGSVPGAVDATGTQCVQAGFGSSVTLTAQPFNANFAFAGWAGDTTCTSSPVCIVDTSSARWVRAKFVPVSGSANICTSLGLVGDKLVHRLNGNYPSLAVGQGFIDPNFGTTLRRLTNVLGDGRGNNLALVPVYSTISGWNADESRIILYRTSGVDPGVHELYDGKTYAFIRTLDDLPWSDIEQVYWDTTNPSIIHSMDNNNFYTYDITKPAGQRVSAVRSFATQCTGGKLANGGSDPFFSSWDSKIFGITCSPSGPMFSFNLPANTLGTLSPASEPRATTTDGIQAAPSGTKLFTNVPSGTLHLIRIFDLNMTRGPFLDMGSGDEHAGSNRLFNGDDTYNAVQFDVGPSGTDIGTLVQWNMNGTPNASNRIPGRVIVGPATGYPFPPSGTHVGGTSFHRTGLVTVSIKGDFLGDTLLDDELLLVDSDPATNPGNFVCRVGHHRTKSMDYWAEPHPQISPSGTRILFGSSWGDPNDPAVVDTYVVELPGYKAGGTGPVSPLSVSFAPASLSFGSLTLGQTSGAQQVTVTNNGTGPLAFQAGDPRIVTPLPAAYAIASSTCGSTLPAGGSCTLGTTFTPQLVGPTAPSFIAFEFSGYPDLKTVPLSGTGVAATTTTQSLTVTIAGLGSGSVRSSPNGVDCSVTCATTFPSGTVFQLSATAQPGSYFAGWGGACSGTGPCSVTMDRSVAVSASFGRIVDLPRLSSISTRLQVLTGNDVLIGGFIVGGATPKQVVVRARGPSLASQGVAGALADPTLTVVPAVGDAITNDDWGSAANAAALSATGLAPANAKESALLMTLNPGGYTAVVSGVGGATGIAIVEVYEVDHPESPLTGISTRALVQSGDNVMIGGFLIQGATPQTVVVRARGPSLASQGVTNVLANPMLQLVRAADNAVVGINDDWGSAANAAQVTASGFAPLDPRESAILLTLDPGAYTAIVSGVGGTSGVGIVEVYSTQ